jgi:hypothetical protein
MNALVACCPYRVLNCFTMHMQISAKMPRFKHDRPRANSRISLLYSSVLWTGLRLPRKMVTTASAAAIRKAAGPTRWRNATGKSWSYPKSEPKTYIYVQKAHPGCNAVGYTLQMPGVYTETEVL